MAGAKSTGPFLWGFAFGSGPGGSELPLDGATSIYEAALVPSSPRISIHEFVTVPPGQAGCTVQPSGR